MAARYPPAPTTTPVDSPASGMEIYTAVLEHEVRTPDQFATWLSAQVRGVNAERRS